jgi:hypothetical protein
MEVMYERYEGGREVPPDNSQGSRSAQGVSGKHIILLFLPCGIFLTAGWGGITALLTVTLRFCTCEQTYEMPQPSAS